MQKALEVTTPQKTKENESNISEFSGKKIDKFDLYSGLKLAFQVKTA